MKTTLASFTLLLLLLAAPLSAYARGGGGLECYTNIGPDVLSALPLPAGTVLDYPPGAIWGLSGYGYGITRGGWKIGGFGTVFTTTPLSMDVAGVGMVTGAAGAFGGVISGGHARIGPFTLALNTRLGAGGMGVRYIWSSGDYGPWEVSVGTFALYGALEAEAGVVLVPAMMVSAYAGIDAVVTLPYAMVVVVAPTAGIRVTWGRF